MGLLDKVQDKFVEKLVNRIVDEKRIIITASLDNKEDQLININNTKKDLVTSMLDDKKLNLTIDFEDK